MRNIQQKTFISPAIIYGGIIIIATLVVLIGGIILAARANAESKTVVASGEHLITVHDNGVDRGILTKAKTLRQAFEEAGIRTDPNDKVEPSLDESLVASHYDVNIYRARPVTVVDGNTRTKIMSSYQTPKQIVEHADIILQDEDITDMNVNTDMVSQGAGLQLTITRATPFVFVLYGKKMESYTQAKTVGEMLRQKDITLSKDDMLSVTKEAPIAAGMTVELWRNGIQTITEEVEIVFEVEQIQDADRPVGYKDVKTPGVAGKRTVSYEVEMKNGQELSRKEIQSVVTKEPVKQVEVIGTKNNYSGSLNEWLLALRTCEAGGVYTRNSGNGFYGAYQFMPSTWDRTAAAIGRSDLIGVLPHQASPADQDAMVIANTNRSGSGLASQHPGCYQKLGLSQFPPS